MHLKIAWEEAEQLDQTNRIDVGHLTETGGSACEEVCWEREQGRMQPPPWRLETRTRRLVRRRAG